MEKKIKVLRNVSIEKIKLKRYIEKILVSSKKKIVIKLKKNCWRVCRRKKLNLCGKKKSEKKIKSEKKFKYERQE